MIQTDCDYRLGPSWVEILVHALSNDVIYERSLNKLALRKSRTRL